MGSELTHWTLGQLDSVGLVESWTRWIALAIYMVLRPLQKLGGNSKDPLCPQLAAILFYDFMVIYVICVYI